MALTAQALSKRAARGKDVDVVVQELLQMIDETLSHHPVSWGRNVVTHELPTTFSSLPNMDKLSSQRIIYSSIIKNLKTRGFEVGISLDKGDKQRKGERTILYIAWKTVLAQAELDAMNKIITDCLIKGSSVAKFVKEGFDESKSKSTSIPAKKSNPDITPTVDVPSWATGATVAPGISQVTPAKTTTV